MPAIFVILLAQKPYFREDHFSGGRPGQFNLGLMYIGGLGVPQDYALAHIWLTPAASKGHTEAQLKLGLMYVLGQGVPQDYVLAHMWLNLGAAQGDPDAAKLRDRAAKNMTPAQIAEAQKLAREWIAAHP